jgi:lipopolysaccharide transport system permease protein
MSGAPPLPSPPAGAPLQAQAQAEASAPLQPPPRAAADAPSPSDTPVVVIEPRLGLVRFDAAELWHYRDLLYFLTWREISIRYKQTLLGFAWAVIQPVMTMVVFTVFLGRLARMPSDGIPYPVFSYLGLLPWMYFSNAVTRSGTSLVSNAHLLSKVYFPRVLIPVSGVLSAAVDFAIAFVVLVGLMLWYGIAPAASTLWLIPLTLLTAVAAAGAGMWLASLNVKYRDVQHAIPFLMQVWMYATPVVYPASVVPERWRTLFALNPLAGVIEAYRAATLGRPMPWSLLATSTVAALLLLLVGTWQFRRMERVFADVV